MKQLEIKRNIVYRWWRGDKNDILPEHQAALETAAEERIAEMKTQGFTSGELNVVLGDEEVEYTGWWEIKTA